MKKQGCQIVSFLFAFGFMSFSAGAGAQQLKLGNKPTYIERSAVLHLDSKDQGLLLTRVSDTTAINSLDPPDGMIIYFTDDASSMPYGFNAGVYQRKDGHWQKLGIRIDTAVDHTQSAIKFTHENGKLVLHLPNATTNLRGVVSSGRQSFSGRKTFNDSVRIKNLHPGSVIFIRDDDNVNNNVLTENNPNFYWDNTNLRLGIGTNVPEYALDVYGDIRVNGVVIPSDIRFKKNIQKLQHVLSLLDSLHAYTYFYRMDEFNHSGFPETRQIGMIAQEVEKYLPELVKTDRKGYKSLNYARFTALLLEAFKEQRAEMAVFKKEMRTTLQDLKEQVSRLETQLGEGQYED